MYTPMGWAHGLVQAETGVRFSVYIFLWDGAHGLVQAEIGWGTRLSSG